MQLRTITNSGHPLQDQAGTILADTPVYFELVDGCSNSAGTFVVSGEYVAPIRGIATTDSQGIFSITLPCTDSMLDQRFYLCSVDRPDCPEFMAPLVYGAEPLPFLAFRLSGDPVAPHEMDAFIAHIQDMAIHTPVGASHNHIITVRAVDAIGGHRVVTISGAYADCGNPDSGNSIAGVSLQAVAAGQQAEAQYLGVIEELSWNFMPGKPVYLGHAGLLTQTPPDSGIIVEIGRAITATTLLINIQQPLYLA